MEKTKFKQVLLFLMSAGATGVIYIGLLFLCRNVLKVNPYLAVSIAYIGAMSFYFTVNKFLVFKKSAPGSVWREILGFLPLVAVNYVITLAIVGFIRQYTHEEYSGSFVAGIVTAALTYFVFDKWLFKKKFETPGV